MKARASIAALALVALSLAGDAKVKAVPLAMHSLPQGGGYEEYLRRLATTITGALSP